MKAYFLNLFPFNRKFTLRVYFSHIDWCKKIGKKKKEKREEEKKKKVKKIKKRRQKKKSLKIMTKRKNRHTKRKEDRHT